jgi:pyruvate/2-oxoglutarate/acetoin dehydrogenase E1 component
MLTYTQAIKEATDQCMEREKSIFVIGLGVTYPNGADGTTKGLVDKYPDRVFDMPCSENAATGLCIGAALTGMRPILVHGRVEFALFGFDQIVTQAAKWNYMFGGGHSLPLVIRAAVGRQWGNGPQHTQVLHAIFGHIPGLKAVIPSTPSSAKGLLISSILDNNPVIFLEHRWLYNVTETVSAEFYAQHLGKCKIVKTGKDLTIVANSDTLIDAIKCIKVLKNYGIDPEIIDLVSVNPVDYETIISSVNKTGRIIVADVGNKACGIGSEIISNVCENALAHLLSPPVNIGAPHCPLPTSPAQTEIYYPTADTILQQISRMFGIKIKYDKCTDFYKLHMPLKENIDMLLIENGLEKDTFIS